MMLHCECVTTFSFGDIAKRRKSTSVTPQATRLLYSKQYETPAIQYGHDNEPVAHEAYISKQHDEYNRTLFVRKIGLQTCFATNDMCQVTPELYCTSLL